MTLADGCCRKTGKKPTIAQTSRSWTKNAKNEVSHQKQKQSHKIIWRIRWNGSTVNIISVILGSHSAAVQCFLRHFVKTVRYTENFEGPGRRRRRLSSREGFKQVHPRNMTEKLPDIRQNSDSHIWNQTNTKDDGKVNHSVQICIYFWSFCMNWWNS